MFYISDQINDILSHINLDLYDEYEEDDRDHKDVKIEVWFNSMLAANIQISEHSHA